MDSHRIIAIAGTPGCGKTTLCTALHDAGFVVETVVDLASKHGCLGDEDPSDGAAPVDVHKLAELWEDESDGLLFVDGHLSHLLDVDAVVLLRCHPDQLRMRLQERDYAEAKITANVEWEMLGGTWSEMLEFELETPVLELNTTEATSEASTLQILEWIEAGCPADGIETAATEASDWLA